MDKKLLLQRLINFVWSCLLLFLPYTFWSITVPMPLNYPLTDAILRKIYINPFGFSLFCTMIIFFAFRFIYYCRKQKMILRKTTIFIEILFLALTLIQGISPMPGSSSEYGKQIHLREMANNIYTFCLLYADRNNNYFPDMKNLEYSEEWKKLEEFHRKDSSDCYQSHYYGMGKLTGTPVFLLFEDVKINKYPRFPLHLLLFSDGKISVSQQ